MENLKLKMALLGVVACASVAQAVSLSAELIMPGGRSWKGAIVGRDGDWVEFSTGANPIRIGAETIEELVFEVKLDEEEVVQMYNNREYEKVIDVLERSLAPYAPYNDIPSNLTVYNATLMELYYKIGAYDKSLEMAFGIIKDARDPQLQEKGRIYRALCLIDSGRSEEAENLLAEYGWGTDLDDSASPEKLFIMAKLMALKKDYNVAMELAAKVVAFHSQDPDWLQPAELLCGQLYAELGMFESAEEVIRQISLLYKDTNEDDLAQKLKLRIDQLRAEQALQEAQQSE